MIPSIAKAPDIGERKLADRDQWRFDLPGEWKSPVHGASVSISGVSRTITLGKRFNGIDRTAVGVVF
jgi:hypothetical protein